MSVPDESLSIESVRALVAERSRFDEWLSALESRRESTPTHVFERVHGDYTARRATVIHQLSAHVPALTTLLQSLDARAESLGATMASHEDERAEAMLRHTVGEFDDATWEEVRSRVESTLETLFGEQVALEEQRDDVRRLLTESTPPEGWTSAPATTTEAEADSSAADAPSAEALVEEASVADAPSAAVPAADAWSSTEEPAVLSADGVGDAPAADGQEGTDASPWTDAVDEAVVSASTSTPEADASEEGGPADAVRVSSVTETLASIEADVVDEVPTEPSPAESRAYDRPSIWGGGAPSSEAPVPSSQAPAAPADAFDELAFLRSVIDPKASTGGAASGGSTTGVGAPQKTLRCTECSTMNLPTEWYCERCGSELASF